MQRRKFLKQPMGIAALYAACLLPGGALAAGEVKRRRGTRLKLCLNAYSFNRELMAGEMTMNEVIDFCAEREIDAVDMTGYYFPGYPEVPSDEVIYSLKKKAFLNGVTISGTGVRNDFALPDPLSRKGHIQLVKDWVDVAAKLGSDVVRVFSGRQRGVILGLQHHDDFLKTAAETIQVVEAVNSEWFSVILDVGSLRQHDVYEEIEKLVPYACTWQVKEEVWYGEKAVPIDLPRLKAIIDKVGYRGFLPIEALGRDANVEARIKTVANFVAQVKEVFFT